MKQLHFLFSPLLILLMSFCVSPAMAQEEGDTITHQITLVGEMDGGNAVLAEWLDADGEWYDDFEAKQDEPSVEDSQPLEDSYGIRLFGIRLRVYQADGYIFKVYFNNKEMKGFERDEEETDPCFVHDFTGDEILVDGKWEVVFMKKETVCDINNDGRVTIADVTSLVNVILQKEE